MNPVYKILGFEMRLNWFELHHGYYGVILMAIPLFFELQYMAIPLFLVGLYLLIDDIYQHHRQVNETHYHSPVHNAFRFLY
jgi:hypothetical protein